MKPTYEELETKVLTMAEQLSNAESKCRKLAAWTVNLPAACADDEYFIDGVFQPLCYERDVGRALRAAGISVKGE